MQNAAPVAEASERRSACAHAVPGGRPMMLRVRAQGADSAGGGTAQRFEEAAPAERRAALARWAAPSCTPWTAAAASDPQLRWRRQVLVRNRWRLDPVSAACECLQAFAPEHRSVRVVLLLQPRWVGCARLPPDNVVCAPRGCVRRVREGECERAHAPGTPRRCKNSLNAALLACLILPTCFSDFQLSKVTDWTKEMCTPTDRWMPEQSRQMNAPWLRRAGESETRQALA